MNGVRLACLRRLRIALTFLLLGSAGSAFAAVTTAGIIASVLSPTCLDYRVVGICYWLFCTPLGCSVRTSVKVRHYVPDAVVSSYANTGENPWVDMRWMSPPNSFSQAGGDGTTNESHAGGAGGRGAGLAMGASSKK